LRASLSQLDQQEDEKMFFLQEFSVTKERESKRSARGKTQKKTEILTHFLIQDSEDIQCMRI